MRLRNRLAITGTSAILVGGLVSAASAEQILEIRVAPPALKIANAADARRLIVSGRTADGFWLDLTSKAKFTPSAPIVKRDKEGLFHAARAGKSQIVVSAAGRTTTVPVVVVGTATPQVSFVRDIMPALSKTGCNAGTCHGSVKGKNGFKLSLRGFDPEFDYHAIVQDISGRRLNKAKPEESLMLSKPMQEVAHQGGLVFEKSSRFYPMFYKWIAGGVKTDADKLKRANRIEVLPASPKMRLPGDQQQLVVIAHYPDGATRDVTRDAVFTSTMSETSTVTPEGVVTAARRGEAAILVRYEGNYAANGITVIGDRTGYKWVGKPQINYIDKLVDAKLLRVKALPSGLCTDEDFVRRVAIDLTGVPPTPEEVRAFLADRQPSAAKRTKLVDALMAGQDFVENWTNKWADLLQCNRKYLGERGAWKFRNWIREAVAENRPYNDFVRQIITATGGALDHPASNYLRVAREPDVATENVTQLFLGIRFSCNKCHDHPFERWTQQQYYQFGAHFARVGYKPGATGADESVYERRDGEVLSPRTNAVMTASVPYSFPGKLARGANRRDDLATWLTAAENPYFAKSIVNRFWSYFLGKGIIDPVDDIRGSNPPSNPEFLDALTADFIKHKFDIKHLMRTITASRTYQASYKPNKWNIDDLVNFSHAVPRRLTAEQLVDAIARATGSIQRYPGVPVGFRAVQLPDTSVAAGGFLDLFGRPARESPCECERTSTVSLGQTLHLINDPSIHTAVSDPAGRAAVLVERGLSDKQIISEIFMAVYCREPTATEMKKVLAAFDTSTDAVQAKLATLPDPKPDAAAAKQLVQKDAAQDLMWALINSPAFLFNR